MNTQPKILYLCPQLCKGARVCEYMHVYILMCVHVCTCNFNFAVYTVHVHMTAVKHKRKCCCNSALSIVYNYPVLLCHCYILQQILIGNSQSHSVISNLLQSLNNLLPVRWLLLLPPGDKKAGGTFLVVTGIVRFNALYLLYL